MVLTYGKAARSSTQLGFLIGFVNPGVVKQPFGFSVVTRLEELTEPKSLPFNIGTRGHSRRRSFS